MKKCSRCKIEKGLNEFFKDKSKKDRLHTTCKLCDTKNSKKWQLENQHKVKEFQKIYRKNHPDRIKEAQKKCNYGISQKDWQSIFDMQEGKCKICNTHRSELKKALCVDHCHKTGRVRGLLCDMCNRGLGYFKDNQKLLDKASDYIKSNSINEKT